MTKQIIIPSVLAVVLAVAALLYFTTSDTPEPEPDGPDVVAIGYPVLRIAMPVFVAKEKGYFKARGVNVRLVRYTTAQPMMDALVGGAIDVGGYCALPITFSAIARSQNPLVFISAMTEDDEHPVSLLIVKKGSPIRNIQSLEGKRIGILPTRAYEVWLEKILEAHGVDPKSVVIQQIPPPQQAAALESGSVHALFTNDPAATAAQVLAAGTELTPGTAIVPETTGFDPFYFGSFNVTKSFADANPDVVRRISLALDDAIDFLTRNPDESRQAMARYLPSEQQGLVRRFPPSSFKKTNETTQQDLDAILAYYLREGILTVPIDVSDSQYSRSE